MKGAAESEVKRVKERSLIEFRGGFVWLTYLVGRRRASAEVDPS
jgi:hypothetical protein